MSAGLVAGRYARALFDIAAEKQQFEKFEQDLVLLNETIKADKDFQTMLSHPHVLAKVKKETIIRGFSGSISPDVLSLVLLLIDRGRLEVIPDLVAQFVSLTNHARNIVDATVYTAFALKDEELSKISEEFGKAIGKTIRMQTEVDPSIIGGVIIRIGDHLYDGSVRGKLSRFKQTLVHS
jgi:F-type H+-transporting ATPase subunit delta